MGEGGIGVVLAATHEHLEQRVAVKYLKPAAARQAVLRERFLREARLAAKLKSAHIVHVHDVGTAPCGTPYMVMEYLEGEDLGTRLSAGAMPAVLAVDCVMQACEALAEMHALGFVHRDLKPENLFTTRDASGASTVKLLDFGISKVLDKNPDSKKQARLTGVSELFGTPHYMPPEQLGASANVDARSDIWAIGVVLHELVTGAQPFAGGSIPEICANVLLAPYGGLGDAVAPPGLGEILGKCLAKEPRNRYRNVAELALALAPFGPAGASERGRRIAEMIERGGESVHPDPPSLGRIALDPPPMRAHAPTVATWDAPCAPSTHALPRGRRQWRTAACVAVLLVTLSALVAAVASTPLLLRIAARAQITAGRGRPCDAASAASASEMSWPLVEPVGDPPPPKTPVRAPKSRGAARR